MVCVCKYEGRLEHGHVRKDYGVVYSCRVDGARDIRSVRNIYHRDIGKRWFALGLAELAPLFGMVRTARQTGEWG